MITMQVVHAICKKENINSCRGYIALNILGFLWSIMLVCFIFIVMEKKYKHIIPFDIELAKKITSGEIEGRIISEDGRKIRVMALDAKHYEEQGYSPILILVELSDKTEVPVWYSKNGTHLGYISPRLVIELPEEAPKQYPYDRVKDKISNADWQEARKTFPDSHNMQSAFISGIAYQVCKEIDCKKSMEHEFKPFDKVLVRDVGEYAASLDCTNVMWTPAIFQFYFPENSSGRKYKASGRWWDECIPYEGNEHLVGTTDNPKEEKEK